MQTSHKQHSPAEIASKLHQADELSQHGKRQVEIARALRVSVMTYHRWRAAARTVEQAPSTISAISAILHSPGRNGSQEAKRLEDLQVENERLRRLVVDFLLEKVRLEEALNQWHAEEDPARGR
jgi:putative transposase